MSRSISESLVQEVLLRARGFCEYCHIFSEDTYFGVEVDHIKSIKHGGLTEIENLALACQPCNRHKGSDLGSMTTGSSELVRFFNPRTDNWNEHFRLAENATIEPLSEIGEVTARILRFNDPERVAERRGLIEIGHYDLR